MPHEILKTIKPRKYQQEIFNNCKDKNCLIVLPTGIGKTLIALMLTIHRQKTHKGKTLFLAPTRPLAEQHLSYFKSHLPELFAEITLFTGKIDAKKRKELWESSDIIFSTPQCISNDIKNNLYSLEEITLLIEDECHRCLKNYAYTYITEQYKEQSNNQQIIGLTASPGTDKITIQQIAKNLGIDTIELRTRDSDDVKEYLQKLEYQPIRLEFPEQIKEISTLIRTLHNKKTTELKNRKLLFETPNKITLLKLQARLQTIIRSGNPHFNNLVGISVCAQALKLSHLIELLETQTLHSAFQYMQSMFEQSRNNQSKAVKTITKSLEFNQAYTKLTELIAQKKEHPKLLQAISLIQESIEENPKNKTIIFTQFRDTAIKISKELNKIDKIKCRVFVGQAKKKDSGLSQKEQQEIMDKFRTGEINTIAATSIAEEGLDIPEVNSVIFYEPIPSALRTVQRRGRTARLTKGKVIILITLDTLDEIYYYASISREKRMYKAIENIKKDLDDGKPLINKEDNQKKLF